MSGKKITKADQKRLAQLQVKLDAQQKKQDQKQRMIAAELKTIAQEKKKISNQWKDLKNSQKQLQADKNFLKQHAKGSTTSKNTGGGGKKFQKELLELKQKFNAESKRARENKKLVDQLTAELKVTKRKLKNASAKREAGEDPRIKHMMHDIKMLKKQVKMLLKELNKKRRWYQRCIKQFKSNRSQWVAQQVQAAQKRKIIIKYVFLDDISKIKQYRDKKSKGFMNKIKVRDKTGGEVVIHGVDIEILDSTEFDVKKGGKRKSGKNKSTKGRGSKSGGKKGGKKGEKRSQKSGSIDDDEYMGGAVDEEEDIELYMADFMDEINNARANIDAENQFELYDSDENNSMSTDEDDMKDGFQNFLGISNNYKAGSPSILANDSAALESQILYLKQEMDARNNDLESLKAIVSSSNTNPKEIVGDLLFGIKQREEQMIDDMQTKIQLDIDVKDVAENNNQWQLWLNRFSTSISANAEQFERLCSLYDYFLSELNARKCDILSVNNIFYNDEKKSSCEKVKEYNDDEKKDAEDDYDENITPIPSISAATAVVPVVISDTFENLDIIVKERHSEFEKDLKMEEENYETLPAVVVVDLSNNVSVDHNIIVEQDKKSIFDNKSRVNQISNSFLATNVEWNEMLGVCGEDYYQSIECKKKIVFDLLETQKEIRSLMGKVQCVPSRKIFES